jgi:hypothetical protein
MFMIEADVQTTDNIYLNTITYSSILNNNKFYLSGTLIDFANNTQRVTLNQLSIDNIDLSNIELTDANGKVISTIKTSESTRTAKARTKNILDSITSYSTSTITNSSSTGSNSVIDGGTF